MLLLWCQMRCVSFQVAHWLVDPMCRGIFAGNSKQLSMKSCFPLIYKYERQYGSIIRGAVFSKRGENIHTVAIL